MASFDRTVILGNLCRDWEVKTSQGGKVYARNAIAINRKSGEKEAVCFLELVVFDKRASVMAEHTKKGSQVLIEGHHNQSNWETEDGSKRSRIEIIVDNFSFVGKKGGESRGGAEPPSKTYDDVPF